MRPYNQAMADETRSEEYAARLQRRENALWKRALNVQAPFRWNLRRLDPGFTLDVGCGIGRNLRAVNGVGVDHNAAAVETARRAGFEAFTPDGFAASTYARPARFDSLLMAHVVEHMTHREAAELLGSYLRFVRPSGAVILIAPQEAGFRSDDTHVEFMDEPALTGLLAANGVEVVRHYSFPFPRPAGRWFRYNEFVTVGTVPA